MKRPGCGYLSATLRSIWQVVEKEGGFSNPPGGPWLVPKFLLRWFPNQSLGTISTAHYPLATNHYSRRFSPLSLQPKVAELDFHLLKRFCPHLIFVTEEPYYCPRP